MILKDIQAKVMCVADVYLGQEVTSRYICELNSDFWQRLRLR